VAVEVDGSVHDDQIEWDNDRTRYLNELGYRVIRFRNDEVLNTLDLVLQCILDAMQQSPRP
jgi:leucyl-tRNA synthetase